MKYPFQRKWFWIILVSFLLIILGYGFIKGNSANAQSVLDLQEKCAEGAKKFFSDRIGSYGGEWLFFNNNIFGHGYAHFKSHYNKKIDKCFIRIELHSLGNETNRAVNATDLWDVFEGIHIGGLLVPIELPSDCEVAGKTCNSPSEFDALIKPYMEE